jgi:hypothetical protein
MYANKKPLFIPGRLLKIEMLEKMRDFTRDFIDIKYKDYSDGIIQGCDIEIDDCFISVNNGIIKYNNVIYILKGEERFEYYSNNKVMLLKVRFNELVHEDKDDFLDNSTEIFLDDNLNIGRNEMELCRFKLREGARLRNNYVDFTDLSTEYDTVNTINTIYSAYGENSISIDILRSFGREIINFKLENQWDINFYMLCLQSNEPIQKEIIITYLKVKLNIEYKNYSNKEIYDFLLQVLNEFKQNGKGDNSNQRGRYKKIILD